MTSFKAETLNDLRGAGDRDPRRQARKAVVRAEVPPTMLRLDLIRDAT
jgi:hypothetical protein